MSIYKGHKPANDLNEVSVIYQVLVISVDCILPRHNQDLIKELARTRSELDQYKSLASSFKSELGSHHQSTASLPGSGIVDRHRHNIPNLPALDSNLSEAETRENLRETTTSPGQPPAKKRKTVDSKSLSRAESNMLRYGRGILHAPYRDNLQTHPSATSPTLPELPPKPIADDLLRQYRYTLHPTIPVLHWRYFQEQYDTVYRDGSLESVPRIWVGLLFAVFALGTLHRDWKEGQKFLKAARSQIDIWTDYPTLDHARAALLTSIFMVEINHKSAGWIWLGVASRVAFDLGLHCEAGVWTAIEAEMRRRVWWCIYACDWLVYSYLSASTLADPQSLLCLQLGRPAMIKEEDCRVGLPSPADDELIHPGSDWMHPKPEQSISPLLPTIQIVGGISRLLHLLQSPKLSTHAIAQYESHYHSCMDELPESNQMTSSEYLDPIELHPIIYLQSARLILHRHNLTPLCSIQSRQTAIDDCLSVARDTAKYLRRCMQEPPSESRSQISNQKDSWERRMVSAVSTFFCMHVWRCTLFLCFRLDFPSALICIQAAATFGDARPINVACGRYVEFFIREMMSRWNQEAGFDEDEEMIAYVSGDLQGDLENSWVWEQGGDLDAGHSPSRTEPGQTVYQGRPLASGPEGMQSGEEQWSGWANTIQMLKQFERETMRSSTTRQSGPTSSAKIGPEARASTQSPVSNSSQTPGNRMSIRDLI